MVTTIDEIREQPEALRAILEELENKKGEINTLLSDVSTYLFIGCGSSYYLGLIGASLVNNRRLFGYATPASELFLSPDSIPSIHPEIIVPISRSGKTTETIKATEKIIKENPKSSVVSITCSENAPLGGLSDITIVSQKGKEENVVMTKSFSSMLTALECLVGLSATKDIMKDFRKLPEDCQLVLDRSERVAKEIGEKTKLEKFVFLGTGEYYGLASEAVLKIEEMTLSWSEAHPPFEFRHGPRSIVDEKTLVTIFCSNRGGRELKQLVKEIDSLGGETLTIGRGRDVEDLESDYQVEIPPGPRFTNLPLYIVPIQFLGYYRAINLGLDPDRPRNLEQFVTL